MNYQWIGVKDRLPTEIDGDENGKVLVFRFVNSGQKALEKKQFMIGTLLNIVMKMLIGQCFHLTRQKTLSHERHSN